MNTDAGEIVADNLPLALSGRRGLRMWIAWNRLSGWWVSLVAAAWGALLVAVLQIQYLPLDAGHSLCGPWGCGPPLPPLLAYHGFWLVLLVLPTLLACSGLTPTRLRHLGWFLVMIGATGLLLVGLWELLPWLPHWLPRMRGLAPRYYLQRYLLSLTTLVDVPIAPLLLAGLACLWKAQACTSQAPICETAEDESVSTGPNDSTESA